MTKHIFFTQQNHPTFHWEERLINLERGRECFVGLSQGWEFALSLFCLSLSSIFKKERMWPIHSRRSLKYCRATVRKSSSSLFKKERPWANHSRFILKKSAVSEQIALKKRAIRSKETRSSLSGSFLKSDVRESITSILKKSDGSDLLFFTSESLFRSFDHKKRAILSKNRWPNSQSWSTVSILFVYGLG